MNRLTFAVVAGIAFGALTVALMLPMSFPDVMECVPAAAFPAVP